MKYKMRNMMFEFSRVTEQGAIAAYKYLGKNNKDEADGASVKAIRHMLNLLPIDGTVVIGEGEMDEAPMLYIGEKVGLGGYECDIALDPIDGTKMVAKGQYNALSVVAAAEKGALLHAPDMYMEKLVVGPKALGSIDLNKSFEENLRNIAKSMNKPVSELTVAMIDRDRHAEDKKVAYRLGCKLFLFENGDVSSGLQTCDPASDVDVMYCIGGAPEGVITAVAVKALGGDMQARLVNYSACYQDEESEARDKEENDRCETMGLKVGEVLTLEDMVKGEEICFSCTAITRGDLLDGVTVKNGVAETHTLLIRGKTNTIRKIKSTHFLDCKDETLKSIFK